jgi:hypothetical protein
LRSERDFDFWIENVTLWTLADKHPLMNELRLPSALERSQRVLVAGAGGGFDVYAALPIYERLRSLGKQVFLANLSFTYLAATSAPLLTNALYVVDPATTGEDQYFPERTLARFLAGESVHGVALAIEAFYDSVKHRYPERIPH